MIRIQSLRKINFRNLVKDDFQDKGALTSILTCRSFMELTIPAYFRQINILLH